MVRPPVSFQDPLAVLAAMLTSLCIWQSRPDVGRDQTTVAREKESGNSPTDKWPCHQMFLVTSL